MPQRIILKVLALSLLILTAAFVVRRLYLWDVMPVSWDQEPQSLLALGAAFLLCTVEYVATFIAVMMLAFAGTLCIDRWRGHPARELPSGE